MIEFAAASLVVGGFTYLRVKRLVENRHRLGHAELPPHMPVLAGSIAVLLFIPVIWLLPSMREHLGPSLAVLLAMGLGVGVGIHHGRQNAGR